MKVRFIMEVAWQAHFVKNMFIRPTDEELKKARRLNRERTSTEKRLLETTKDNINELIDNIEKGTVDSELLPELNKLMKLLKRG